MPRNRHNGEVLTLDTRIDELYQLPLDEFTAARNALAKTVTGPEAKRIRSLVKPHAVPWAVNQLYWKAGPAYERLLKSGAALRAAQIAALHGRRSDVRAATEAHRSALAAAAQHAADLAARSGSHPNAEAVARMLEAISLAAHPPDAPGRFTEIVQPAGLEALTGVTPSAAIERLADAEQKRSVVARRKHEEAAARKAHEEVSAHETKRAKEQRQDEERRAREALKLAREEAVRRKKDEAALNAAEWRLERARTVESKALRALETAKGNVQEAERLVAAIRARMDRA
jgi:hypothetical protein